MPKIDEIRKEENRKWGHMGEHKKRKVYQWKPISRSKFASYASILTFLTARITRVILMCNKYPISLHQCYIAWCSDKELYCFLFNTKTKQKTRIRTSIYALTSSPSTHALAHSKLSSDITWSMVLIFPKSMVMGNRALKFTRPCSPTRD